MQSNPGACFTVIGFEEPRTFFLRHAITRVPDIQDRIFFLVMKLIFHPKRNFSSVFQGKLLARIREEVVENDLKEAFKKRLG